MISTPIERRGDRIVWRPAGKDGMETLVSCEDTMASYGFLVGLSGVEEAVRKAYAAGRADNARQTAAILRGLLGGI